MQPNGLRHMGLITPYGTLKNKVYWGARDKLTKHALKMHDNYLLRGDISGRNIQKRLCLEETVLFSRGAHKA